MRLRALRPDRVSLDRGSDHYRVGYVRSITGGTSSITVLCDPGFVRTFSVATSLLPCASKGAPLCARLTGTGAPNYTIAELIGTSWGGNAPKGGNESSAVDDGSIGWPIIPREITNEPVEYAWTSM